MAIQSGRDKVFKLIARGTELDLFQDETIYLSNNVTGLFDLGKLPSDFTRQITIPGTKKNNDFFQHVYDISIDNPFLFKTNTQFIKKPKQLNQFIFSKSNRGQALFYFQVRAPIEN